jgi:CheY-like chemotaxis protein
MDERASFIEALASLAWPIIAIVAIILLFPSLRRVVRDRPFSIKIGSFEMTAQEASEALLKQITDLQNELGELRQNVEGLRPSPPTPAPPVTQAPPVASPPALPREGQAAEPEDIDHTIPPEAGVRPIAPPAAAPPTDAGPAPGLQPASPRVTPSAILWVDDHPENNAIEITRLTDQGHNVTTCRSTKEAIDQLGAHPNRFGVLITDLGRGLLGKTAGLDTIREARQSGFRGSAIIYTSPAAARDRADDAAQLGASITGSPSELLRLVRAASPDLTP